MEVVHQQHGQTSFPSPDAHFNSSSELHQQQQQSSSSPSISQQSQSSHQQQQQQQAAPQQSQQPQQPSPESPSASLSQNHAQTQAAHPGQQQQGQNQQWSSATHHHHQQHPHLHLLPISVPLPGTLPAVSASPSSYSPASAHTTDGYPFFSQQTGHPQSQSQPVADGGHRAHGHGHGHAQQGMERSASLSLNISSLSVQSPANLSPLTPSPHPSTASTAQTLSPITPLSPSTTPHAHHYQTHTASNRHPGQGQGPNQGSMFAYAPPSEGPFSNSGAYDSSASAGVTLPTYARAPSSRSSSAASTAGLSTKSSIPRKRSFHNAASMSMNALEVGDPGSVPGYNPTLSQSAHDFGPGSFEEVDVDLYSGPGGMDSTDSRSGGSPGEGESSSGDGDEDPFKALSLNVGTGSSHTSGTGSGIGNGLTSLSIPSHGGYGPASARTTGTNNFVTKLYQMINDPKSAMFIQWTELGTSFVVSNVGEFSRTILGTHFKHNNFSSFVRQLNMYGFHKINRTPRGGRTSSSGMGQNTGPGSVDQQVWEFSHHKFLRGRPDLLDEIKRKALDPDPGVKQRVELPGELAAQLNQMRDHHRRVVRALEWERAKGEKLVGVVRQLSDVVSRAFPGSVAPFPPELWEPPENNPPIFITSPSAPTPSPASASSRGYAGINGSSGTTVNGMALPNAFSGLQPFSPGSSPTASEFPHPGHAQHGHYASTAYQHHGHHGGHLHHLNRAHSMQNIPYDTSFTAPSPVIGGPRYDDAMELDASLPGQGIGDRKRQRTGTFITGSGIDGKRLSRARSDSAPLGYGAWGAAASAPPTSAGPGTGSSDASSSLGRPRSGSGLAQVNTRLSQSQMGMQGRRDELMVNISGIGNSKNNSPGGQSPSTTSPLVPKAGG